MKRAPNDGFPDEKKKAKAAFNVGLCLFLGKLNCGYISVSLNLPQLKLLADASQF